MSPAINPSTRRSSVWPYVAAIVSVAAVLSLVSTVRAFLDHGAMGIFLIVVILLTWFAGWKPGVIAIVLSSLCAAFFIFPPRGSLLIASPEQAVRLAMYVVIATLITVLHASRERARDAAWKTEQRLAFALECANMGAWYSDLRSGRFWWSRGTERLFGRAPGDFSGTYEGFIGYIHPEDQDFVRRAVTRTIEGGREFEIEHRIVTPTGQTRRIHTRGRIVCDERGEAQQVIGVVADITASRTQSARPSEAIPE